MSAQGRPPDPPAGSMSDPQIVPLAASSATVGTFKHWSLGTNPEHYDTDPRARPAYQTLQHLQQIFDGFSKIDPNSVGPTEALQVWVNITLSVLDAAKSAFNDYATSIDESESAALSQVSDGIRSAAAYMDIGCDMCTSNRLEEDELFGAMDRDEPVPEDLMDRQDPGGSPGGIYESRWAPSSLPETPAPPGQAHAGASSTPPGLGSFPAPVPSATTTANTDLLRALSEMLAPILTRISVLENVRTGLPTPQTHRPTPPTSAPAPTGPSYARAAASPPKANGHSGSKPAASRQAAKQPAQQKDFVRYVVRFTQARATPTPEETSKRTPYIMTMLSNKRIQEDFPTATARGVRLLSAQWNARNNIILTFPSKAAADDIKAVIPAIRRALDINPGILIEEDVPWTKIVLPSVQTRDFNGNWIGPAELLGELTCNSFMEDFHIVQCPDWLTDPVKLRAEGKTRASISFAVADPSGAAADVLLRKTFFMFGDTVKARRFKEKPAYTQCQRCLGLGHGRSNCPPGSPLTCNRCAGNHSIRHHVKKCEDCLKDGIPEKDRCPHKPCCANCKKAGKPDTEHYADSRKCPLQSAYYRPPPPPGASDRLRVHTPEPSPPAAPRQTLDQEPSSRDDDMTAL
jgi:hypothetical protein